MNVKFKHKNFYLISLISSFLLFSCAPESGDSTPSPSYDENYGKNFAQWGLDNSKSKKTDRDDSQQEISEGEKIDLSEFQTSRPRVCGNKPSYFLELKGEISANLAALAKGFDRSEEKTKEMLDGFFKGVTSDQLLAEKNSMGHKVNFCLGILNDKGQYSIKGLITDKNFGADDENRGFALSSESNISENGQNISLYVNFLREVDVKGLPIFVQNLQTAEGEPVVSDDYTYAKTVRIDMKSSAKPKEKSTLSLFHLPYTKIFDRSLEAFFPSAWAEPIKISILEQSFSGTVFINTTSDLEETLLDDLNIAAPEAIQGPVNTEGSVIKIPETAPLMGSKKDTPSEEEDNTSKNDIPEVKFEKEEEEDQATQVIKKAPP